MGYMAEFVKKSDEGRFVTYECGDDQSTDKDSPGYFINHDTIFRIDTEELAWDLVVGRTRPAGACAYKAIKTFRASGTWPDSGGFYS